MEVMTILILLVLNIALPTLDTFTDINLVVKLYRGVPDCDYLDYGDPERDDYLKCREDPVAYCSNDENNQNVCYIASHPKMATAMFVPFLLNYFVCLITFLRKEEKRKIYLVFALLNIYPQFVAARIIYLLVKNPSEGKKKKKIFDQDVGLLETCLESVPSTFIITVIWLTAIAPGGNPSLSNIIFKPNSTLLNWLFGVSAEYYLYSRILPFAEFFITYAISIISAALGLAKCLKNGVARPIAPGGCLDGLLSGKFLLAFLASGLMLAARAFCIGFIAGNAGQSDLTITLHLTLAIIVLFLPQFLLSLFSTVNIRDKSSMKILYRHPSLIILPTVTFFTFSRLNIGCDSTDSRVSFSKKFSYTNIVLSIVGFVCWGVWFYFKIRSDMLPEILMFTLPGLVFSIINTILFLNKLCCWWCCCNPREHLSLSVYDPDLDKRFIMVEGEVVEDPEDDGGHGTSQLRISVDPRM